MNGYKGMCMSKGKFLKPWQVRDKIIEWIFMQVTFNIWGVSCRGSDPNSKTIITKGFENSGGDVYGGKVS